MSAASCLLVPRGKKFLRIKILVILSLFLIMFDTFEIFSIKKKQFLFYCLNPLSICDQITRVKIRRRKGRNYNKAMRYVPDIMAAVLGWWV